MPNHKLSEASKQKLSRLIATINQFPESEIGYYLQDDETTSKVAQKEHALKLILTLKHYANPLAGYPAVTEVEGELKNVISALSDPTVLEKNSVLTLDEKEYLIELLRIKLDTLANENMQKYGIEQATLDAIVFNPKPSAPPFEEENFNQEDFKPSAPPMEPEKEPEKGRFTPPPKKNSVDVPLEMASKQKSSNKPTAVPQFNQQREEDQEEALKNWWNYLTQEQQEEIIKRYKKLNKEQKAHLKNRTYCFYHYHPASDLFYYRHMCLIDAELNYLAMRTMIDLTALFARGLVYSAASAVRVGVRVGGSVGSSWGRSHHRSSSSKEEGSVWVMLAAIAAFCAAGIAAVAGSIYALKKAYNSTRNIFQGHKVLRSLYRLISTGGGVYGGIYAGAILGAMLGSVVPGLGTAAGAILGVILGAGIGAGLGALFAKYSAKLISAAVYRNELNPTNPDKWRLNKREKKLLLIKGISPYKVEEKIKEIKDEKRKFGVKSSFFWTDARKEKNKLNKELKSVKKGEGFKLSSSYPPPYVGLFQAAPASLKPTSTSYYRNHNRRK